MSVLLKDRPIITFYRGGEELVLGRGADSPLLHLHGSTGLGLPPVNFALTDNIGADGSTVRGVRYTARDIFIPVLAHTPNYADTSDLRDRLYGLLAPHLGPVTIRLFNPVSNSTREVQGYLKDGLEGDFANDFHGTYQTFGLTFTCPDPWWTSQDKLTSFRTDPATKPFISKTHSFFPIMLASSSVQGNFNLHLGGEAPVSPIVRITGPGVDPSLIVNGNTFSMTHTLRAGESITIDSSTGNLEPVSLWEKVPLSSKMPVLSPGMNKVQLVMSGGTPQSSIEFTYKEKFLSGV